jgi:ferritin-like metal-binding protein YciE
MKLESLRDAYMDQLREACDVEEQLVKAIPKMIKGAATPELRSALEEHLEQTKVQVQRLERVFESMGQESKTKKCLGLRGILDEGEDILDEDGEYAVRDALLISGAQKVEHYEMAMYGTLITWAEQLGDRTAVELLRETLEEEKSADKKLTQIAESSINQQAAQKRVA